MNFHISDFAHYAQIGLTSFSAGFWLWSALLRLPQNFTVGWGGTGGTSDDLMTTLKSQSRLNAFAAACMAAAIVFEHLTASV